MNGFVPSSTRIGPPVGAASEVVFVVHGIMGSGRNWRSFGKSLAERRPGLALELVDLRHHGESQGAEPPNDLPACAADLARLAERTGAPRRLIGHSFGGKVVLECAVSRPAALEQIIVLDCPITASPDRDRGRTEIARVLAALEEIDWPLTRRTEVTRELVARGFDEGLARWMSTNLIERDGRYTPAFSLTAVRELIEDYWSRDYQAFAMAPPASLVIDLVRAAASDRWSSEALDRLHDLPAGGRTRTHVLPDAGHWLHVDNPDGLLDLVAELIA